MAKGASWSKGGGESKFTSQQEIVGHIESEKGSAIISESSLYVNFFFGGEVGGPSL